MNIQENIKGTASRVMRIARASHKNDVLKICAKQTYFTKISNKQQSHGAIFSGSFFTNVYNVHRL